MSYQVLARKWRPKLFQQLMGQEHVVTVLMNALSQQRLHHAYLFTGTRGVGKTTIARIFAKSLNCEQGITAEPCGICDVCQDIDQGRFIDLLEIDAASRTKVDDTREILDNVQYAPTRGRYKVYLIDEVHMLSRSSFNALLKTLEEPPEHVKFILATTDPQKLPVTVLSRCLQFHLKALTVSQIEEKLNEILGEEQVTHESGALTLLAKAARGSMRDALSLTDQAIAKGQGAINVAHLQQMLGGIDQNWVYKILIALLKQDPQGLMNLSLEIASYTPNYSRLLAELIQLFHQVAMVQVVNQHFDLPAEHEALLLKFSQLMSAEDIQLYYQIALNGRKDLPYTYDEQAAFDMVLLRLLAFKPMSASDVSTNIQSSVQLSPDNLDFSDDVLPAAQISSAENTDIITNKQGVDENAQVVESVDALENERLTAVSPSESSLAAELQSIETSALSLGQLAAEPDVVISDIATDSNASQEVKSAISADIHADEPAAVSPTNNLESESVSAEEVPSESLPVADLSSELSTELSTELPTELATELPTELATELSTELVTDKASELVLSPSTEALNHQPQQPSPLPQNEETSLTADNQQVQQTSVDAVLATRNMLRSRKKTQESKVKKSDDAILRQQTSQLTADKLQVEETAGNGQNSSVASDITTDITSAQRVIPAADTLPQAPYTPNVIDPAKVRLANQVDKWANMIDSMALGGRLRQLAIHATICARSTDEKLVLQLDQSTKHLKTDVAHQQLQSFISEYLQRQVLVEIEVVEQTVADPYQIQADINDKRYGYAKALILADNIVVSLQNDFQATVDEQTIAAL